MCGCKVKCCCVPMPTINTVRPFIPDNSNLFLALLSNRRDGYVGPTGPQGPIGPTGATGPKGDPGECQCGPMITESNETTTTTSSTDVLMDNMTLTPPAGTYAVWFSGELDNSQGNSSMVTSIYVNGTIVPSSQRLVLHNSDVGSFCCMALVNVNGFEPIEGFWRTNKGTATNFHRTLLIIG